MSDEAGPEALVQTPLPSGGPVGEADRWAVPGGTGVRILPAGAGLDRTQLLTGAAPVVASAIIGS